MSDLERSGADAAGPASGAAPGRYRPIGDYAFLGDCHTGALVSSDGSVDWPCPPRLDDGSYFGRLLEATGRLVRDHPGRPAPAGPPGRGWYG